MEYRISLIKYILDNIIEYNTYSSQIFFFVLAEYWI